MAQAAAGIVALNPEQIGACNVSGPTGASPGSGLDILDALALAQHAVGLAGVTLSCC